MRNPTPRHSITGSESVDSRPPLDYLQSSPVRGQLEPYKEKTRAGWRFLQCTDTPDELKVLLPPRTAQIYSQLLDAETSELAKERDASWERILEIRRLKERMIRKCGRLSRVWGASKPGTGTLFRTVYAPADFRLKEMEKWIRYQENGAITIRSAHAAEPHLSRKPSTHHIRRRSSFCCDRCAAATPGDHGHHSPPHRRPSGSNSNRASWMDSGSKKSLSSLPRRSSTSSIHSISIQNDGQSYSQTVYRATNAGATEDDIRGIHAVLEPYIDKSNSHTLPRRRSSVFSEDRDAPLVESPRMVSPDPLPHPYRPRNPSAFTAGDVSSDTTDEDTPSTNETVEPGPSAPENSAPPRPQLLHRRSSLKKSTGSVRASMDAAKNVAWAMDQDWQEQVKKYDEATSHAEVADRDWENARATYEEELAGMKSLRTNLSRTLAKLRAETEKLEREDEVMKEQEGKLRESFKQLEETQTQYRSKVQAVLDETKGVLSLCSTKRSVQFGPEA